MADTDPVIPTVADRAEIRRLKQKVDSIGGPGVNNGPAGVCVYGPPAAPQRRAFVNEPLFVQLTGGAASSGFTWQEATPPSASGGAAVLSTGRTSDALGVLAFDANGGGVVGQFCFIRIASLEAGGAVGVIIGAGDEPPEFYGQVKCAVANGTWGATLLPLVNLVP